MRIGLLYNPTYWPLLEDLIVDLEREIRLVGGESFRLSPSGLSACDVDIIYSLPCDCTKALKLAEKRLSVINSTWSQEIAMDKVATSRRLLKARMPTPETIISQTPDAILEALESYGILLLKSTNSCGGAGHRVLKFCGRKIVTISRSRKYQVIFGDQNRIRNGMITLAPPYYAQQFIGALTERTNNRVFRMYVVGKQVVMGTIRAKWNVETPEASIVNAATGASYEFLPTLDNEMESLALQVSDLIGFEIGAVDFLKDRAGRTLIIEADCDGSYLFICRKFQEAFGYNNARNFNGHVARHLKTLVKRGIEKAESS